MKLHSNVVHLVHHGAFKNAKLWHYLLFVLISLTALLANAREIDLTEWKGMDPVVYEAIIHGIHPGDTVIYKIDGVTYSFNILKRLNKFDGKEGSSSDIFLLENGKVLRIPDKILSSHTQVLFAEGQKGFADAGINVVKIFPESHPPDFILEEYVRYISLRAALFLLKDNDAGHVMYEMGRRVDQDEREHIKSETLKFIQSLAVLTEVNDFGVQQAVYDVKEKKIKVFDFYGEPKRFDPASELPQTMPIEFWHDPDFSQKNGRNVSNKFNVSLATYEYVTNIIEQERIRIRAAHNCNEELNLINVKPGLSPTIHPPGPTGT